ncbi:MAG: ATP/GTP-binding protein [Actinomycetota bacterium]
MASAKIVVTGPFGAGKTTFIRTISEITVLSTERVISDHTAHLKESTTVAMDFGRITVDPSLVLYLFGTPGQKRFDFMWEMLAEGMLGFIMMVDRSRSGSIDEAKSILDAFRGFRPTPAVIAVNKHDPNDPAAEIFAVRQSLLVEENIPVICVDAMDRASVKNVVLGLLYSALEEIDTEETVAIA